MKCFHRFIVLWLMLSGTVIQAADNPADDIAGLRSTIAERRQQDDALQQRTEQLAEQIKAEEKIQQDIADELKRFQHDVRRIEVLADKDSDANKQKLNKLEFEIKRAGFNLEKSRERSEQLTRDFNEQRRQGRILKGQISMLQDKLAELEKQQQQRAAEQAAREKQRQAEQAAQARAAAARAAEQQAQQQKQAEQQRLAAEQAEREQAQQAARQQQQAQAATRAKAEAEAQAQAKTQASPAPVSEPATAPAAAAPATAAGNNPAGDSVQQQVRRRLIASTNSLPPAQSALTLAMAIALESPGSKVLLGHTPDVLLANPVGSTPRSIGQMQHLGNNQYLTEVYLQQGLQQFIIGDFSFTRNIPVHFNDIRCLLLLDARNPDKPVFQLVVAGG
ncbi:MAG TPA: hypothetical protein VIN71_03760 [Pseudomonadales bacterium]